MTHAVIGTAGHVDHGKTALVRALTGVDTDRLPDEKRRGISIDIGFAELNLPSGRRAAIVDVPGHERFIRNMVAGASGVDLALLVVAADEGVMPQTREHLDIMQLLGIERGCVALTKLDLVEADWLELVRAELAASLAGSFLDGAPVVACSAATGQGLDELRRTLDDLVGAVPARTDAGPARLPVDRVFSVAGFGTVVTGTLVAGAIAVEDRLELWPAGRQVRVRGLQVHGEPVSRAVAGQRTAANLVGVERIDLSRGAVLATPGSLEATNLCAVRLGVLPRAPRPIKSGERLHLHTGTAEVLARVALLAGDELAPGASSFAQLTLDAPLAVVRGDRYIVRSFSPVLTLGGGTVLVPGRRYRRFEQRGLEELALREGGGLAELLVQQARRALPVSLGELAVATGASTSEVAARAAELVDARRLIAFDAGAGWQESDAYRQLAEKARAVLQTYHARYPLRFGMPRKELRQELWPRLDPRLSAALMARLADDGVLVVEGERVAVAGRKVELSPAEDVAREHIVAILHAAGLAPPPVAEVLAAVGLDGETGQELLFYLVDAGELVRVDETFFFEPVALAEAIRQVRAYLGEHDSIAVAALRDLLGTTRKYAVPLAEYLDRVGVTRREGDVRRLAFGVKAAVRRADPSPGGGEASR